MYISQSSSHFGISRTNHAEKMAHFLFLFSGWMDGWRWRWWERLVAYIYAHFSKFQLKNRLKEKWNRGEQQNSMQSGRGGGNKLKKKKSKEIIIQSFPFRITSRDIFIRLFSFCMRADVCASFSHCVCVWDEKNFNLFSISSELGRVSACLTLITWPRTTWKYSITILPFKFYQVKEKNHYEKCVRRANVARVFCVFFLFEWKMVGSLKKKIIMFDTWHSLIVAAERPVSRVFYSHGQWAWFECHLISHNVRILLIFHIGVPFIKWNDFRYDDNSLALSAAHPFPQQASFISNFNRASVFIFVPLSTKFKIVGNDTANTHINYQMCDECAHRNSYLIRSNDEGDDDYGLTKSRSEKRTKTKRWEKSYHKRKYWNTETDRHAYSL